MKNTNSALILTLICFTLPQTAFAELKADVLKPYNGPSVLGVDPSTLTGKVMTGYQGWFNCEGDGAHLGWTHWTKDREKTFGPGNITVDLWPDVSEYDDDELYITAFTYEDGSPVKTFSSHNRKTVVRHFKWMADYGPTATGEPTPSCMTLPECRIKKSLRCSMTGACCETKCTSPKIPPFSIIMESR